MIGVRPTPTARYVARPRLLDRLPDSAGHVVWLEAPYGYGKSVLTLHWAERLEAEGWRVLWASLAGREPLPVLAAALGAAPANAWGTVLEALWSTPTLLVLEDLEGSEPLEPLLRQVGGMVALSSRLPLPWPALPLLQTSGRLVHLRASDLAFTEAEAETLLPDRAAARRLWRETAGWSLPLHFASLTGAAPDRAALLEGVRASVDAEGWEEALLVATLDLLPNDQATPATDALASAGFVQRLDAGYRVHPLVAETALERHVDEARAAVLARAGRLPGALRGRAFARIGLLDALAELLADERDETYRIEPSEYLRWHALAPTTDDPVRRCFVAVARMSGPLGATAASDVERGIAEATALALDDGAPARWRSRAALAALFTLAERGRLPETPPLQAVAEALAAELPPFEASRVARTLVTIEFHRGDHDAMERHIRRARDELMRCTDDPRQREAVAILEQSVAQIRFELHGEVEGGRAALGAVLDRAGAPGAPRPGEPGGPTPMTLGRVATVLAVLHQLAGDRTSLRDVTERWASVAPAPFAQFLRAHRAKVERDLGAFPGLVADLETHGLRAPAASVAALWLDALHLAGEHGELARLRERFVAEAACRLALARHDAADGQLDEAEAALVATERADPSRAHHAAWLAAAFEIRGDEAALDELIALLDVGVAVLPALGVPLGRLPRSRPELAARYPLDEVLASGWPEAIAAREADLPPLHLTLLGGVAVHGAEGPIELSERQRQLLALLALGTSREAIGTALWPELDGAKVRNNLNVLLSGLRKALQPWGLPTYLHDGGLRRVESDLERVERALAEGDWTSVAAAYAGPLAAGIDLDVVRQAADDLERRVLEGLRTAADASVAAGESERAIELLDRLLLIDPLHEEALRDLVELLLRSGRRREARRRYRALADRLRSELGVEPDDETRKMVEGV